MRETMANAEWLRWASFVFQRTFATAIEPDRPFVKDLFVTADGNEPRRSPALTWPSDEAHHHATVPIAELARCSTPLVWSGDETDGADSPLLGERA